MQMNSQKQPFSNLISDNPVKKGYSPNGAIWSKPNPSSNKTNNGTGLLTDVNASTGIDNNNFLSIFGGDPPSQF